MFFFNVVNLLKKFQVEIHVEFVGDSPLPDPNIIDEIIGFYLKHTDQYDYVSNGVSITYPNGMEVNVYPASILIQADTLVSKDDPLREHVDIHIYKNSLFRCKCLKAPPYYHRPDIYLEVDTENDFQVVSTIYEHFDKLGKDHFTLAQIFDFLDTRPDLIKLNQDVPRRYWKFKK